MTYDAIVDAAVDVRRWHSKLFAIHINLNKYLPNITLEVWCTVHNASKVVEIKRYQDIAQTYTLYMCYPITWSLSNA